MASRRTPPPELTPPPNVDTRSPGERRLAQIVYATFNPDPVDEYHQSVRIARFHVSQLEQAAEHAEARRLIAQAHLDRLLAAGEPLEQAAEHAERERQLRAQALANQPLAAGKPS